MSEPSEVERLVRIETKLDILVESTEKRGADHETRLRALEKVKWIIIGGSAVTGGAAGLIAKAMGIG